MSQSVSQMLREARLSRGLTQQQLADKSGLDRAQISHIERGDYQITTRVMLKYIGALSMKVVFVKSEFYDFLREKKAG